MAPTYQELCTGDPTLSKSDKSDKLYLHGTYLLVGEAKKKKKRFNKIISKYVKFYKGHKLVTRGKDHFY